MPGIVAAADGNLPGGTAITVQLDLPRPGTVIQVEDGGVQIQGSASVGQGPAVANTLIVYVLDVSGSVNVAGEGCGGDANGDSRFNTVLDCEIVAAQAVNAQARAAGSVGEVGVVTFSGHSRTTTNPPFAAVIGDVGPADGIQTLTAPTANVDGLDGADVEEVLASALVRSGTTSSFFGLREFTSLTAGQGNTNYYDGIQAALTLVGQSTMPNKLVIFMSDGANTTGGSISTLTNAVIQSGAVIHSFAVGSDTGFSCTTNNDGRGSLIDVARLSEPDGTCTDVGSAQDLPDIVPALIESELTGIGYTVDDVAVQATNANVTPALPQTGPAAVVFNAVIPVPAVGPHTLCVSADGSDAGGTGSVTDCADFLVNGAPIAGADAYTTTEDATLTVAAPGILENDEDPNGDTPTPTLLTPPQSGSLSLSVDGSFVYTPTRHVHGVDSFTYLVTDAYGASSAATTVTLTVTPDAFIEVTNLCDDGPGSLRAALSAANSTETLDTIVFDIIDTSCGDDGVIRLASPLPTVDAPVVIDGTVRDDGTPQTTTITVDGSAAGEAVDGLAITSGGGGSTIVGLTIVNFTGSGIVIGAPEAPSSNNTIVGNTLAFNGDDGVTIVSGVYNQVRDNDIHDNGDQAIDLGGDGPTPNDVDDADEGANFVQNYPVLFRAEPSGADALVVEGWLDTVAEASFSLQLFAAPTCNAGEQTLLPIATGTEIVTTDANGEVYFQTQITQAVPLDWAVRGTATDAAGNTSEISDCILVSVGNDSWPRALTLVPGIDLQLSFVSRSLDDGSGRQTWTINQYLDQFGQARWYRFAVQPDSEVLVTLDNLPANYDLTLYKDIAAVFADLVAPADEEDLHRLSAEFAPSAFSPSAFSPSAFSPSAFSPSAFSPSAFSPSAFSPSAFSPSAFSPSAFSPSAFSPSAFSPSAFSPSAFSPSAFSPSAFSPSAFSPSAFSSAQMRALVGVSAIDGAGSEQLRANTWTNAGDFYVRVRGREGAFDLNAPFTLNIALTPSGCDVAGAATLPAMSLPIDAADYRTLILTDPGRMDGDDAALVELADKLLALAKRSDVRGAIVDLGADARIAAANAWADGEELIACPYAKNVVADSIKQVIDAYRAANPGLEYIVLVGSDDVIPFFRYPDNALLGDESNFFPPVLDDTASQASLRRSYVLGQDAYGADVMLSLNATDFPVPQLAVGRLLETPADIMVVLDAYLDSTDGLVPTPASALVTGYDFLEDAALAVQAELEAGLAAPVDSLITPADQSPLDPTLAEGGQVWTALDLATRLRDNEYDLLFLAGHFNANSALAADYATSLISTDVRDFAADLTDAIVYSVGCHSGYNIVNDHGIPGVTFEPDWAQVFAQRGATLIAGTGYQYGDTEFLEYSERLYLEFTRQLRTGEGPVAVGDALVRAKQRYLETTPSLRGIHEKSLLEATLFGLPMVRVDLPGARLNPDETGDPVVTAGVQAGPGAALGLETADFGVVTALAERVTQLVNIEPSAENPAGSVQVTWLEGGSGVVTNAAEPTLPLEVRNVSASAPGLVLRGVGLRGAVYADKAEIIPFTGAPTTELRGVHSPFFSDVFYPLRFWNVNYFGELTGTDAGTGLALTPAQHRSTAPGAQTSTLRTYSAVDFRLYYSGNVYVEAVDGDAVSSPSSSAPPTIVSVSSTVDGGTVTFQVQVVGNPAAGIQEVWITYTGVEGSPFYGRWQSLDLVQDSQTTTLWTGTLVLNGADPADVRFIVQAANGVGLVGMADDLGRYYRPGAASAAASTTLALQPYVTSGPFGGTVGLEATLRLADGSVLPSQLVYFALGVQGQVALTDANGVARVTIPLLAQPGDYDVRAVFPGTAEYAAASANGEQSFAVTQQATTLCLDTDLDNACDAGVQAARVVADSSALVAVILEDANTPPRRQPEQSVLFTIQGNGTQIIVPTTTDYSGRAVLAGLQLPPGEYTAQAAYPGTEPLAASTSESFAFTILESTPDCSTAFVEPSTIWPPENTFVPLNILGVTSPGGSEVTVRVDNVCQDEAVSNGGDAVIQDGAVQVRSKRAGGGNGRAYQVDFTATNASGGTCQGSVLVVVLHDQDDTGQGAVDELRYNSLDRKQPAACLPPPSGFGASLRGFHVHLPLVTTEQ
jgi:parallel beta-helix repeat protein